MIIDCGRYDVMISDDEGNDVLVTNVSRTALDNIVNFISEVGGVILTISKTGSK